MAELIDQSGTVVFKGTVTGLPAGGIPQGGPLTTTLVTAGYQLRGSNVIASAILKLTVPGADPGDAGITGGSIMAGNTGADVTAGGATAGAHGKLSVRTNGATGLVGSALVRGAIAEPGAVVYGGVIFAAGPPVDPPEGSLPFAVDTTPVTGGLYAWNRTSGQWVKVSALP